MSNKIDLRQTLRKYKRELNSKYPDPEPKPAGEEPVSPQKGKAPPPKEEKKAPAGKDKKGNEPSKANSNQSEEEDNVPYGDLSELDSVIDDEID